MKKDKHMKPLYIIFAVCLLAAGIGSASAGNAEKAGPDERKRAEKSEAVELFAGKRRDGGERVSMKCRVVRRDTVLVLQARILNGDFAVRVARQGLLLELEDGSSLTLRPERESACCGDWALGRWNNLSFRLSPSDVGKLKECGVVSVVISTGRDGGSKRSVASGRRNAVGEMIRTVE